MSRLCSLVVNVLDFDIVVIEFDLQFRHYVHFHAISIDKGMSPFNNLAMIQIAPLLFLDKGDFGTK